MKTVTGSPSRMTGTLEKHDLEQLLKQLGGKSGGPRKAIYQELGEKYGLSYVQLYNIYRKEVRVRGHENDPSSVQVNGSPTMENSPEQDEAKTVLHEDSIRDPASPQEQNIVDPAITVTRLTNNNADFPHGPVPELDDDHKDLLTAPATTPNIKQESLDHTQSGAYSPYEPVPKLESGLADYVRMDSQEVGKIFPAKCPSCRPKSMKT
ncbi:hypothetical protein LTR72_011856 [Exophiala xenobiotica]|nr:hypothetical protein LTR72_011856 [Exophiala xenobiotica]KAK5283401.1 hypothetical protein LTR14_011888 [Exophiala xenobiotica]KAK5461865.1 hypothetical protein LTR55_011887 [Exophiala xenobiotica]